MVDCASNLVAVRTEITVWPTVYNDLKKRLCMCIIDVVLLCL